jgi:hypothetical protein
MIYCNTPAISGDWVGWGVASADDVCCKVDASRPEGFDFGGYDAFFVGFAGGFGEGGFEVSVAVFPCFGEVRGEFYFGGHFGMDWAGRVMEDGSEIEIRGDLRCGQIFW